MNKIAIAVTLVGALALSACRRDPPAELRFPARRRISRSRWPDAT
jgi:hypothetical protein